MFSREDLLKDMLATKVPKIKETHKVRETKELLRSLTAVGLFVGERAKDGLKLNDLFAIPGWFLKNRKLIVDGFKGINKVPKEVGDLTPDERRELATFVLDELLPQILKHLKGKK